MDDQPALDPQDEAFIDEAVKSGRYSSRADVISDGLQLVREREEWLAAVRAGVQRGLDDVEAGRVVDLDEAFDQVEAMLDEMEAARRA
jgi:antitoxin ParD1/3/4